MKGSNPYITTTLTAAGLLFILTAVPVFAQSSIESKIEDRNERIEELNEEISQYESELESTENEKNTLQETVSTLDETINRVSSQIDETRRSAANVSSRIQSLESSIQEKESDIRDNKQAIGRMVAVLQRTSNQTFMETLLAADSLADAWGKVSQIQQLHEAVQGRLENLRESREELNAQQAEAQNRRDELSELREEYADRQAIVVDQKEEKAQLLQATNQQASEYEQIIAEKRAQKEEFEAELRSFEEQLNSSASDAAAPNEAGQFAWPVSPVRITQQFGGTEFAKRNPGAYGRPFHNGTDFGIPVGTDVAAVADGSVRATGNTDAVNGCYSYGKWVLVDHNNGLSTLYAHLSRITAREGEGVLQGDRIGYSGNTGYSTGPHLHLTTYLQSDVEVVPLGDVKERTNCASAEIPVAPLDSYLNSMNYLE